MTNIWSPCAFFTSSRPPPWLRPINIRALDSPATQGADLPRCTNTTLNRTTHSTHTMNHTAPWPQTETPKRRNNDHVEPLRCVWRVAARRVRSAAALAYCSGRPRRRRATRDPRRCTLASYMKVPARPKSCPRTMCRARPVNDESIGMSLSLSFSESGASSSVVAYHSPIVASMTETNSRTKRRGHTILGQLPRTYFQCPNLLDSAKRGAALVPYNATRHLAPET